ncbi:MAG: HAD-IC family P-type ATPase, partial [Planctomycetaceae bacterium]
RDAQASARVLINGIPAALIELQDTLRPDAAAAVAALQEMGIRVQMLSGDRPGSAAAIAAAAGIQKTDVTADATPEQKLRILRNSPPYTVMAGDGLNDAAALTAAPVGIAIACGTGAALQAASVVVPGNRLLAIPDFLQIARETLTVIRQNLFLAFFYNGLAIPLAALGILGQRGPLIAAVAMALSDLAVVGNALRLKRRLDKRPMR